MLNLWGQEFVSAYSILIVLAIGQFVNISTGSCCLLLVMTGHEKIHSYISFCSLLMNVVLNIVLIIRFGALGAAIATATTVIFENFFKLILAKRKTSISLF